MNSDGRRCDNCNNEIYEGQRYCDKCGYRLNHSIVEGKLRKGKTKRRSRYDVRNSLSKLFGCCGSNNEPISSGNCLTNASSYSIKIKPFADITSKENINRDIRLQSEYNADQYTRERHDIDIDAYGPFPKQDIHKDENLQSQHDKYEEPRHIENSIEIGPAAIEDTQRDEHVKYEHDGVQEAGDIEISIKNGPPARKDIQTGGCLLSENDGFEEDAVIENSFEKGPSDIENTQIDEMVESGLDGGQKPGDIEISIEKGPSDIENTQIDEMVESGLDGGQKPGDIEISIEKGPSAIENIQRDEVVESGLGGDQEPGGIEISIENGRSAKKDIQVVENVQSENDGLREPGDIETSNENGPPAKKDMQTEGCLQSEHDGFQEDGDINNSIENVPSTKEDKQRHENLESKQDKIKEPDEIEDTVETGIPNDLLSGSDDGDPSSCSEKHLQSCLNGSDNPEKVMMKLRNEIIKFAVTGRSCMGKSTFINLVRDVYPKEPGFAEVGFGDCTMIQREYMHPRNKHITFTDLPGFGTDTVTKDQFSESIDLSVFDFVLIFIDSVIMEDDVWVVKKLRALGTPYCFVRSKIDLDISNAKDMGKDETKVISEIRQKLQSKISGHSLLKGSHLFLISNKKIYFHMGDIDRLFKFIGGNLSEEKRNSLLFFLPIMSPEMIETKFQMLQKRIEVISVRAAVVSAIPVPFLDTAVNLVLVQKEIKSYIEIFQLDKHYVEKVPHVKKRNPSQIRLETIVTSGLKTTANIGMTLLLSQADCIIPIIGSAIAAKATSVYVRAFLSKALLEMKNDAIAVYTFYTEH